MRPSRRGPQAPGPGPRKTGVGRPTKSRCSRRSSVRYAGSRRAEFQAASSSSSAGISVSGTKRPPKRPNLPSRSTRSPPAGSRRALRTKEPIRAGSLSPSRSSPLAASTSAGRAARTAAATFSGRRPPASPTGTIRPSRRAISIGARRSRPAPGVARRGLEQQVGRPGRNPRLGRSQRGAHRGRGVDDPDQRRGARGHAPPASSVARRSPPAGCR